MFPVLLNGQSKWQVDSYYEALPLGYQLNATDLPGNSLSLTNEIIDYPRGYYAIVSEDGHQLNRPFQMALFKKQDGSYLVGLSKQVYEEEIAVSYYQNHFLVMDTQTLQWEEVSATVCPEINVEDFFKDEKALGLIKRMKKGDFPAMQPMYFRYFMPRKGTTVLVKLDIREDDFFFSKAEIAYLQSCRKEAIELKWNRKTGRFE